MTFGQTRHIIITHQPSSFPVTVGYPQPRTISAHRHIISPLTINFPLAPCHSPLLVTPRFPLLVTPRSLSLPLHVTLLTSHQRPTIIESAPIPSPLIPTLEKPSAPITNFPFLRSSARPSSSTPVAHWHHQPFSYPLSAIPGSAPASFTAAFDTWQ